MPPAVRYSPGVRLLVPDTRARRELRVAVVSILAGMAIGATIMAIHAGQAAETDAVSGHAKLKSSAPEPLAAVPAASPRIIGAEADLVEAIKPYPIRMVRVRSSKAPSPLAGIPFGRTEPPERPVSAGPASPRRRGSGLTRAERSPLEGVFLLRTSGLRRLRGWAYRIRTGESVRELSDWNFVTTSPEVVQARRRRPFALELRCTNLQLRRIFSSLAGYYGDYSLAALGDSTRRNSASAPSREGVIEIARV